MGLLPGPERTQAIEAHEEVEQAYRRAGLGTAMQEMVAIASVQFNDRELDVELLRPDPRSASSMAANINFFITRDAPTAHQY